MIRQLTKDDALEYWSMRLRALQQFPASFGVSYEEGLPRPLEKVIQDFPEEEGNFILGAFSDEQRLVGMVGLRRENLLKMAHTATIWGMYVDPEAQKQGIGRELMKAVIERGKTLPGLEQILLTVILPNPAAQGLYKSMGFIPYGLEKRSIKVGNDYFNVELMALDLTESGE